MARIPARRKPPRLAGTRLTHGGVYRYCVDFDAAGDFTELSAGAAAELAPVELLSPDAEEVSDLDDPFEPLAGAEWECFDSLSPFAPEFPLPDFA